MSDTKCTENPHCESHGFDRSLSIAEDRYVCDCEGWTPAREMFDAIFEATALLKRAADGFTWDDDSYERENRLLKAENQRLREALTTVREWKLPRVKDRHGMETSYEWEYGSNGVRDYMKAIASVALLGGGEK